MLAALLCNQPYTVPSNGHEPGRYYRRPNEKVVWQDDWQKAQEELTEFKALPEDEKQAVVAEAIEEIKAAEPDLEVVADAQEAIEGLDIEALLCCLEELNILLVAYFMLKYRQRRENEIAALLMLGVL